MWNYRIFKTKSGGEDYYYIGEAYYNKKKKICGFTQEGTTIGSESLDGILNQLEMIKKDIELSKDDIIDADNIKLAKM